MSLRRTGKMLVRSAIAKCGLLKAHALARKLAGESVDHLFQTSLAERFAAIYRNRVWVHGVPGGVASGLGSELANTGAIRQGLPALLRSLGTQTLLDIGCGDFTWMKEIALPCRYIGVDIVDEVIRGNQSVHGQPGRSFAVLDATRESLPPADTVLCREVLFHLSFEDIWRVLRQVRASGAAYFLATNDPAIKLNADILSGDFRMLNLSRAPFHFGGPIDAIADDGVAIGRTLSAWRCVDLPPG